MKKLFVLLFVLVPLVLLSVIFLTPDRPFSDNENRKLQTKNSISLSVRDGQFQKDFEAFLSDQFPLKDRLKAGENQLRFFLGARDLGGAYVCENGRLIQKVTDADVDVSASQKFAKKISRLSKNTGVPAYAMYVPSAAVALQNSLPAGAPVYDYDALFLQLEKAYDGVEMTDLKDTLSASEENYYLTDHHWTAKGAYAAYCVWCASHGMTPVAYDTTAVCSDFRGTLYSKALLKNTPYDTLELPEIPDGITVNADGQTVDFYDLTALQSKDKYNVFQSGNHGITEITNPSNQGGKTVVIFKDSFANSLAPYLIWNYHKIVLVDERYTFLDAESIVAQYNADEIGVVKEIVS